MVAFDLYVFNVSGTVVVVTEMTRRGPRAPVASATSFQSVHVFDCTFDPALSTQENAVSHYHPKFARCEHDIHSVLRR